MNNPPLLLGEQKKIRPGKLRYRIITLLKWLGFLLYFPLCFCWYAAQRVIFDKVYYPSEKELILTTARIIFTHSQRKTWKKICLKFWRPTDPTDEAVRERGLFVKSYKYLLDGLAFNQKFAPGVYLGLASVFFDGKRIQRGRLIRKPAEDDLKLGEQYAVVMYTLKDQQRLDQQLIGSKVDAGFLAREIVAMHCQANKSSPGFGTSDRIFSKLKVNIKFYHQALEELRKQFPAEYAQYELVEIDEYLRDACIGLSFHFAERYEQGHIRRCHGDLKVTNLWIRSALFPSRRRRLLALDSIDFNPEFCNIDTLSDVAMLAVDLERLCSDPGFIDRFLGTYLDLSQEDLQNVKLLLEYYMTEKAMVCMYVSVLFDRHDGYENNSNYSLAMDYLRIAAAHARCLGKLLEIEKTEEVATPTETIQNGSASTAHHSDFR